MRCRKRRRNRRAARFPFQSIQQSHDNDPSVSIRGSTPTETDSPTFSDRQRRVWWLDHLGARSRVLPRNLRSADLGSPTRHLSPAPDPHPHRLRAVWAIVGRVSVSWQGSTPSAHVPDTFDNVTDAEITWLISGDPSDPYSWLTELTRRPSWHSRAACRGAGPDAFILGSGRNAAIMDRARA